jgi:hypothetical protein
MIIEICPFSPHAVACTDKGESIVGSEYESDMNDCTKGGDAESACQYVLDTFPISFRVIAKDYNGNYQNRPATDKEMQLTCEGIYFDSESDFSDISLAKLYLVWEAANGVESEEYN